MKDLYKHDPEGVMAVVSSLREKTSGYNDIITNLDNFVNTVNDSSLTFRQSSIHRQGTALADRQLQ